MVDNYTNILIALSLNVPNRHVSCFLDNGDHGTDERV